jgi:hypothetical protein
MNLYEKTDLLLSMRTETVEQIAREVGLHPMWLRKFKSKQIKEPGVHKTQKLHDWLVSQLPEDSRNRAAVS